MKLICCHTLKFDWQISSPLVWQYARKKRKRIPCIFLSNCQSYKHHDVVGRYQSLFGPQFCSIGDSFLLALEYCGRNSVDNITRVKDADKWVTKRAKKINHSLHTMRNNAIQIIYSTWNSKCLGYPSTQNTTMYCSLHSPFSSYHSSFILKFCLGINATPPPSVNPSCNRRSVNSK